MFSRSFSVVYVCASQEINTFHPMVVGVGVDPHPNEAVRTEVAEPVRDVSYGLGSALHNHTQRAFQSRVADFQVDPNATLDRLDRVSHEGTEPSRGLGPESEANFEVLFWIAGVVEHPQIDMGTLGGRAPGQEVFDAHVSEPLTELLFEVNRRVEDSPDFGLLVGSHNDNSRKGLRVLTRTYKD